MNSKLLKRLALFALAALLLVGFAFVVARSGPLAPVQVTVIEAAEGRVSPALFGIGTVEARRAYLIGPTAPGRVLDVRVDVGETVRAGQLLAEMDRSISGNGSAPRTLPSPRPAAPLPRPSPSSAISKRAARSRSSTPVATWRSATRTSSAPARSRPPAGADLGARRHRRGTRRGGRRQTGPGRLQAERAALEEQGSALRLLAPSDGIVSARDAEPGSTVVAGQAVLRMVEPASLWVRVRFDQAARPDSPPVCRPRWCCARGPGAHCRQGRAGRTAR